MRESLKRESTKEICISAGEFSDGLILGTVISTGDVRGLTDI